MIIGAALRMAVALATPSLSGALLSSEPYAAAAATPYTQWFSRVFHETPQDSGLDDATDLRRARAYYTPELYEGLPGPRTSRPAASPTPATACGSTD